MHIGQVYYSFLIKPLRAFCAFLLLSSIGYSALAADCYTTANDTWSCGIPSSADNLFINHQVTITGNYTATGNITISNGGNLTITGNLTTNNNDIFIEFGVLNVDGSVTIGDQSTFTVEAIFNTENSIIVRAGAVFIFRGTAGIDGNVTLDAGSTFIMKKDSDFSMTGNFTNNSNLTEVDGVLTIAGNLINNNLITGVGEISFSGCSGSGLINDVTSGVYCSSSPIDMFSSHCSATDSEPPEFISYPTDMTGYMSNDQCESSISWSSPVVQDNCSINELISTHQPGDVFQLGSTTVTYTVSDKADNYSEVSFDVLVLDTISPAIQGLPNLISIDAELSTCGAIVNWTDPTAIDNCSAILSADHAPGEFFPIGITEVTYSAIDPSGNEAKRSFSIEVTNPHFPVFNSCPLDTMVYVDENTCDLIINWIEPTVEGCGISITQSHKPGDLFSVGIHNVSYTATDISDNTVTCNFVIQVLDTFPPVFEFCPEEFAIESVDTLAQTSVITWEIPLAKDLCSEAVLNSNYNSGDSFDFGSTIVIYTATDLYGNESTCRFEVQSGINNPPTVESQQLSTKAGESIKICLIAQDPDGDEVSIKSIDYDKSIATISDIDSIGLCFTYTAFEDYGGTDLLQVEIIDSGLPQLTAIADITLEVMRDQTILPSSAITTNGDGINDEWIIKAIDLYPDNSVRIVDPWGGLIFEASAYDNLEIVWNGTNTKGAYVPTGTYFFIINPGNEFQKITGAIEVIR